MSDDVSADLQRLHEEHRQRTEELARVTEYAAEVHDRAAVIHEGP